MLGTLAYYFYFTTPATTASIVGSGGVRVGGQATIASHSVPTAGAGSTHFRYSREERGYAIVGCGGVRIGGAAVIAWQQPHDVRAVIGEGSIGHVAGSAIIQTGRTARQIFDAREEEDLLALTA